MRWKIPAGILLAFALLIPPASAMAQPASPGLNVTPCQTVVFADVRKLVTIDLGTASDTDVRVLANQILATAIADSLTTLPGKLQARLDGTAADLRAFLQTRLQMVWSTDLRIAVDRTMPNAGSHVQAAAQQALDNGTVDAFLGYLNDGLYVARGLECAS